MNTPSEEPSATGKSSPDRRRKWWPWIVALALAAAVIWLFARRPESLQARTEREINRILSDVRREDQSSFNLRSIPRAMQNWPPPFPKLAAMLMGDEDENFDSMDRLSSLGSPAVPILTNLLVRDRSPAVRSAVAQAFGEMGDARLLPHLMAAYKKETEERVQSSILDALGSIGDEQARPLLISVLQGTNDPNVRASAARALGNFESTPAIGALTNALITEANQSVRSTVASALQSVSDPAIKPILLHVLKNDSDDSVRQSVIQALSNHPGDDTMAALIDILRKSPGAPGNQLGTGPRVPNYSYRSYSAGRSAVSILSRMTNGVVRSVLLEVLTNALPEVRAEAAEVLENFPGPDTESALLKLLMSDTASYVRSAAVKSLGGLGAAQTNRSHLPALLKTLQTDADPEVRIAAAQTLGRIGGNEVVKALQAVLETERQGRVQVEAIGGIFRQENAGMAALLLRLLDNPNLDLSARNETVRCLGQTRHASAQEKLTALLTKDPEDSVRQAAATALGSFDNTNAVAALANALATDAEPNVRGEAATALGKLRSARTPAAVSALITALQSDRDNSVKAAGASVRMGHSVRGAAATALGLLRDPAALPALDKALQRDPDASVRAEAATALGGVGRPEAVNRLESAFRRDRNHNVRANALNSFAALTGTNRTSFFIKEYETNPAMRRELMPILGRIGSPEIVTLLLQSLAEEGWVDRAAVAEVLGSSGDTRALAPLLDLLTKDRSAQTRAAAATALGVLGRSEAVPALETALQDKAGTISDEAAWALGHIGDARAVPALSRALAGTNLKLKFPAAFALAEIGDRKAVPALEPLLRQTDEQTRLAAASALAFLDDPQGMTVLNDMLHSSASWQRFAALISLLRLNTTEARHSLTNCHDADPTLAAVIEAGLRLGGAGAATNLLATAQRNDSMTENYHHFGARVLVFFNDPATLPVLLANANDPQAEVRTAVRVAIRRIQKRATEPGPLPPAR